MTSVLMLRSSERSRITSLWDAMRSRKLTGRCQNHKCLIVIKERISKGIHGVISECETTVEYLKKVESQFTSSSKIYVSCFIKMLVSEKYTGDGMRDHILRISNVAARLKPLDLTIKNGFLNYFIFNSLLKEFETFEVIF
jgi:hypothetical protein